ncbi:C39 family peptidase [Cohnella sp.]|uniref:C39 family peptidase n=1 Tax=Cohnella sp. TaxID=1883426 RepID=UPI0037046CFD
MENNPVYYSQEDPRWKSAPYTIRNDPKQTIGTSACGPTCFAMVAATWRDKSITPPETAKWAVNNGYRTVNSGTAWNYFKAAAEKYKLPFKQTANLEEVKRALSNGALVIASMGPGDFTGGGHYILLVGISEHMIDVFDPNHDNTKYGKLVDQGIRNDGKVRADESVFKTQARQYWIFTKPKNEEDEPMTATERKAFETLEKKVDELTSMVTTLTMQIAAGKELVPPPPWFEIEFEKDGVLKRISSPKKQMVFWETLAVSLRMQGLGKGSE